MSRYRRLTIDEILAWADAYRAKTGSWPRMDSGPVLQARGLKWKSVDSALRYGLRGLLPGGSLAQLLCERRGVPNMARLPRLREVDILKWAKAFYLRFGRWPKETSGRVLESPTLTWREIDRVLRGGYRGLAGGSSLPKLLAKHYGVRNHRGLAPLTVRRILAWADAFHERTGRWPTGNAGPVRDAFGETWRGVETALRYGRRGFSGGSSLARLLAERRGVRNRKELRPLRVQDVLGWARAHRQRTGAWPRSWHVGQIPEAPGESWHMIDRSLRLGLRSLPKAGSLVKLLAAHGMCEAEPPKGIGDR